MKPEFTLTIGDDPDHEDLVAEITCRDELVCMITQELGFELLEIEIHPKRDGNPWCFKLLDFEEIIDRTKARLGQLRKGT